MRIALIYIMCLISLLAHAQSKYDANWVLGDSVWLDFRDTANVMVKQADILSSELSASISDSSGSGLFYIDPYKSNPDKLFYSKIESLNGFNVVNGDSILCNYSTPSGAVILPVADSNGLYVIVHLGYTPSCGSICYTLYYTIVLVKDQNITVMKKNVMASNYQHEEHMAITLAANGKDWWIVTHEFAGDDSMVCSSKFLIYKLVNDSITLNSIQSIGYNHCLMLSGFGEYSFSPNGSKLACLINEAEPYTSTNYSSFDLFDFNRCSGILSNEKNISSFQDLYGCAFSSSGKYLFVSEFQQGNRLYRFNVDTSDIQSSKTLIWTSSINREFGQLELCPTGDIIVSRDGSFFVDKIINSDSLLPVVSYIEDAIYLEGQRSIWSLPNFPNYNLGATSIYQTNAGRDTFFCTTDTTKGVNIGPEDTLPGVQYHWLSSNVDTTLLRQIVKPDTSTWYYLEITDTTIVGSCTSRVDSVFVEVRNCTGIDEPKTYNIQVYPNPASSSVCVMLSGVETSARASAGQRPPFPDGIETQGDCLFRLYNLLGEAVLSQPITSAQTTIPLNLPEGIYIYKILVGGEVIKTDKLVVVE